MKYFLFLLLAVTTLCDAAWVGPEELLYSGWGNSPTEFYVEWGGDPNAEFFPVISDVADDGWIAISNYYHFKLYTNSGQWVRNVVPPYDISTWPIDPGFVGENIVLVADDMYFISRTGDVLAKVELPYDDIYMGDVDGKYYVATKKPTNNWLIYSSEGVLLDTLSDKPLVLGRISDQIIGFHGGTLHKVTIKYPDKEWKIVSPYGACDEYAYKRGANGNLYCVGEDTIKRFSACGKTVAEFTVPSDVDIEKDMGLGIDPVYTVVEHYGDIKMGNSGDVYTSKVTQDGFSVLKWVWQDAPEDNIGGPDTPTKFKAAPGDAIVNLSWRPSLQDPGCVTGYEIERASTSGGPYSLIGTVDAGVRTYVDTSVESGNIYYYQMHALSPVENSPDTVEVSASAL